MPDNFDDLMKYWEKTTDEHVAWQDKKDSLSIEDLFRLVVKLLGKVQEFEELVKDMKPAYESGESTLIAAKFKNRYEIYRYLSFVLLELCYRLFSILKTQKMPAKKELLDPTIKNLIEKQVRLEVSKAMRKSKKRYAQK